MYVLLASLQFVVVATTITTITITIIIIIIITSVLTVALTEYVEDNVYVCKIFKMKLNTNHNIK